MSQGKSLLSTSTSTVRRLLGFLLASVLAGVLTAGTLVPLVIFTGTATNMASDAYAAIPSFPKNTPVPEPSVIYDRKGKVVAKFFAQDRKPVKLKDISPWMQKAIVSVEDERFYEHGGADPRGILRAAVSNLTGFGGQQGASTITQQYVNNRNILNQISEGVPASELTISGNKSVADKAREIKWANEIEQTMSKDEILEGYLNLVLFSGTTYGIEAASQRFFSIPAKDLNIEQSAMLAGMVQRPGYYNPVSNPEVTIQRRNAVLGRMLHTGAITQKEYDEAVKKDLELKPSHNQSGCTAAKEAPYFCTYVYWEILNNPEFGKTQQDREYLLLNGGLKIHTTLDMKLQKAANKQVREAVPEGDKGGLGSAIVSRDNKTGDILAMAQNTKFGTSEKEPDAYTEYNFAADRSHGGSGGFQGGSTAKVWTAMAWIEAGKSVNSTVNASRRNYTGSSWKASCLPGKTYKIFEEWNVSNAIANQYRNMPMNKGLYWSINSATVAEAYQLDLCDITLVAERMGLLDGQVTQEGEPADAASLASTGPSLVIGSQSVTPLSQARGFGAFANEGKICENRVFTKITGADGTEYKVPEPECKRIFEEKDVSTLNSILTKIAGERIVKGRFNAPTGGKTGTNDYATSTWFAGYTEGMTTVAWIGRKDGTTKVGLHNGIKLRGNPVRRGDSMTHAGPMWAKYMAEVYKEYDHGKIPNAVKQSSSSQSSSADATSSRQAPAPARSSSPSPSSSPKPSQDTKEKKQEKKDKPEKKAKPNPPAKKENPPKENRSGGPTSGRIGDD